MTQSKQRFSSFEAYLSCSDELEGRYLLIDGELMELPPESETNDFIARLLLFVLANAGIAPLRQIAIHTCELQVPLLQPKDPANRFPDLVVLRKEHISLTQRRLTVTLDMPPPQLVAEVVSLGKTNRDRDYLRKRAQYAAIAIPEYWLIDPEQQSVTVLQLQSDDYVEFGIFRGSEAIASPTFGVLALTAEKLFATEQ